MWIDTLLSDISHRRPFLTEWNVKYQHSEEVLMTDWLLKFSSLLVVVRFLGLSELRFKVTSITWVAIVQYENQSHVLWCRRLTTDLLRSDPSIYWCALGNCTCTWIEGLTCELLSKVALGMQHPTSFKFSGDPSHQLLFLSSPQRVESVQNGLWGVEASKYAEGKRPEIATKRMGFITYVNGRCPFPTAWHLAPDTEIC